MDSTVAGDTLFLRRPETKKQAEAQVLSPAAHHILYYKRIWIWPTQNNLSDSKILITSVQNH